MSDREDHKRMNNDDWEYRRRRDGGGRGDATSTTKNEGDGSGVGIDIVISAPLGMTSVDGDVVAGAAGGGEENHPLLCLHRSVCVGGDGGRGGVVGDDNNGIGRRFEMTTTTTTTSETTKTAMAAREETSHRDRHRDRSTTASRPSRRDEDEDGDGDGDGVDKNDQYDDDDNNDVAQTSSAVVDVLERMGEEARKRNSKTTTTATNRVDDIDERHRSRRKATGRAIIVVAILISMFLFLFIASSYSSSSSSVIMISIGGDFPTMMASGHSQVSMMMSDARSRMLSLVRNAWERRREYLLLFKRLPTYFPSVVFWGNGGGNTSRMTMDRLGTRLALGIDLLRRHDDPVGSSAACEFVVRAILEEGKGGGRGGIGIDRGGGRWDLLATLASSSSSSSLTSSLDDSETRVLSKALLCVGEAALASWSSPLLSSSYHRGSHHRSTRDAVLVRARESLEAATAVDPTDPAVRCGLGLTYLLLGTMTYDTDDDDNDNDESSLQYIFRSIQHLRAALGLVDAASSELEGRANDDGYDEAIDAIRYAVSHNLGLAYIALDGKGQSLDGGKRTTHFADWARSSHAMTTKSRAFSSNVGAMMLQMGMFEDATSRLGSIGSEFCGTDSLPSSRREVACSIVRRNLDVARASLNREIEGPNAHVPAKDTTLVNNQLDGDASSGRREDPHIPSEGDDVSETAHGALEVPSFTDEGEAESNSVASNERTCSSLEINNKEEVIDPIITQWGINTVKPEMRNALAALEKAATEGTQRTRLLLALARARSSTGDLSGAVDASLKAIGAATSGEEMESSTSYLESLMDTMAKQNSEERVLLHEESATETLDETPTSRDFSLLEMKLELERLKYKVLEQEMRLGYQKHSPNPVNDVARAIGYQKQEFTIPNDAPRRVLSEIKQNKVTGQISTTHAEHVPDEIQDIQEESNVAADDIQEGSSIVADDGGPVLAESSASNSNNESSSISNATLTEYRNSDAATDTGIDAQADVPSTKTDVNVDTDFHSEEDAQSLTKKDAEVTAEPNSEPDVGSNTEAIVSLPVLFSPELKSPPAIPPTAKSYMKMADAYLDKGQFALASKQFLKVMKKAPDHLPAYLGYATALERTGKGGQIHTAALAYGNATKLAIIQGIKIDSMAKAGAGGIAENILRRAVALTKSGDPSGRLDILHQLVAYAHTNALAADIYLEIGLEMSKQNIDRGQVVQTFKIANEYVAIRNDADAPFHIRSIIELCKNLFLDDNFTGVIDLFNKVKNTHMEDDLHTDLLVVVGRAHAKLGDLETAISEFTRALAFPLSSSTPLAHHELASALKKSKGDEHEIKLHYQYALEKGMDISSEAIESLGERNIHVMRALNRQYYKSVNGGESTGRSGGGIMSGTGVGSQSSSVFAPKAKQNEDSISQSDTLSILEQGAASYDGHSPMGGEVEGIQSSLSNLKATKQQGSESNLQKLKR